MIQQELKTKILEAYNEIIEPLIEQWNQTYWQEGQTMPESARMAKDQYNEQYLEGDILLAIDRVTTVKEIEQVYGDYQDFVDELYMELKM